MRFSGFLGVCAADNIGSWNVSMEVTSGSDINEGGTVVNGLLRMETARL